MNETKKRCSFARICEALLLLFCTAALIFSTGSGYVKKLIESYRYPREFREYVEEYAALYGVEANIVYAIIKAESGFCRTAVSRSGAIGLMQVIPDTYLLDIRDNIGLDEPSSVLFQAKENIQSGTYYFANGMVISVLMSRRLRPITRASETSRSGLPTNPFRRRAGL